MNNARIEINVNDKVQFSDGSHSDEILEVVSWNDNTDTGRVEDQNGNGWHVKKNQLIIVEKSKFYLDDAEDEEDTIFWQDLD